MLYFDNPKQIASPIIKALIKLLVGGIFIGLLKSYDWLIALVLFLKLAHSFYYCLIKSSPKKWILAIGMVLTGIAGVIGETWGVTNGYWEYHEVSRELPLWLPFAWMLAFWVLYKLELGLIQQLKNKTLVNKLWLAFWISLIIPAAGEMITIYLGVWTYYWPYQILGVPLYAFICLVALHMAVYLILHYICKKYQIKDVVFS